VPAVARAGSDRDYEGLKKSPRFLSNARSLRKRIQAVHAARQRAIAMCLEPLDTKAVAAELYKLRRSVPDVVDEIISGRAATLMI
jgi:hypothetical protein